MPGFPPWICHSLTLCHCIVLLWFVLLYYIAVVCVIVLYCFVFLKLPNLYLLICEMGMITFSVRSHPENTGCLLSVTAINSLWISHMHFGYLYHPCHTPTVLRGPPHLPVHLTSESCCFLFFILGGEAGDAGQI